MAMQYADIKPECNIIAAEVSGSVGLAGERLTIVDCKIFKLR